MANKNGIIYQFGDFRLNSRTCVLFCGDAPVALKPKTVETLIALIETAGEVVSKDDLMSRIWKDTFVAENNLSVNIYALRKMFAQLGDGQEYIQTVSRRGFRFSSKVEKYPEADRTGKDFFDTEEKADEITVADKNVGDDFTTAEPISIKKDWTGTKETDYYSPHSEIFRKTSLAIVLIAVLFIAVGGSIYKWRGQKANASVSKNFPPQNAVAESETGSPEARDHYLRGYRLWQTRDTEQMDQGIDSFNRALDLDPNFAAAYLGLADSYSMLDNNPAQWRMAEEYADKALALAPDSADAHATKGFILAFNKWQWTESEQEFKHALELDDNSGKAHQWYATWLMINRRFTEAETHLKRAIEIYPESPNYNADLAEIYSYNKNYDAAQQQCRRLNDVTVEAPKMAVCKEYYALFSRKRFDEAAQMYFQGLLNSGRTVEQIEKSEEYRSYKNGGWRGWMEKKIEGYENSPTAYSAAYHLSVHYALVGNREKALQNLEKAYTEHLFLLPFANVSSEFDDLRDEPRFKDLIRRVGLRY